MQTNQTTTNCLVVGGAPSAHKGLDFVLEQVRFDAIYAVDAGFSALEDRGIEPQGVFGDFDSLGYVPESLASHVNIEAFNAHKDFTDMDWALNHAAQQGFTNIVLCDALHARLDHSLGNLALMARVAKRGERVWGITEDEVVLTLSAEGGITSVFFDEGAWGTCSVLSHSDAASGVNEYGLEYQLKDASVTNDALWGISNELVGKPASVSLETGSVWVFAPLKEIARISYAGERLLA